MKTYSMTRAACLLGSIVMGVVTVNAVQAATWCGGTVNAVLTDGGGRVYVIPSFRGDWLQICNIRTAWKNIEADVCKSWLATVTALRLTRESMVMHYSQDLTCNAIPSYDNAPSPAYISINVP